MNVLLLNNTEKYHAGSWAVIQFLKSYFKKHNFIIPKSIKKIDLENIDLIVLNGEGTMHHLQDRPKAVKWLEILNEASLLKTKTALINTVWQNNSLEITQLLKHIDYISVRDVLSKKEILKDIDKPIDVNLDLSYYYPSNKNNYYLSKTYNLTVGNYFKERELQKIQNIGEDQSIDIFSQSWTDLNYILKKSKLLVTGRHHEMYAACKAECPFIVIEGNSHKNQGLLKTFEVDIPVLPIDSKIKDIKLLIKKIDQYKESYSLLFQKMQEMPPLNILKHV